MATAVNKCHSSLGSYAKNGQILLPWESDGCHFETEPPGTLLHYEAYSKVSYLFNTTQPEEAPQILSPWEITEEKLEFYSVLSDFIEILGGFTQNTMI